MRTAFERLQVYQLSEQLADAVWDMAQAWDLFAKDTVGKKLVKAAGSVGANIAEGFGHGTGADNRRFVRTARGSLNETHHWLRRAYRRKLMTKAQVNLLKPLVEELGPRFNAYLKSIRTDAVGTHSD